MSSAPLPAGLDALPAATAAPNGYLPAGQSLASSGMSDVSLPDWATSTLAFAADHRELLILGGGTLAVLAGGFVIWRWWRKGAAHERVGLLAVALATAFAAEGMFEVARQALHLPVPLALVLFAMFEVVMLNQALLAKHKLSQDPPQDPAWHVRAVWAVAALSGVVASLNSQNMPEFALRIAAPAVAAGIWWMSLVADRQPVRRHGGSWRWTPRRLLLWLGAIEPEERDMVTVDRDRRIDQMTTVAHKLHHGSPRLARWRSARLRRLTLGADDDMVAEVHRRVDRVHRVEQSTKPGARPVPAEVSELTAMVREQARTASDRIRRFEPFPLADGARVAAFGGHGPANAWPAARPNGRPVNGHALAAGPATTAANRPASPPATDAASQRPTQRPARRPAATDDAATTAAKKNVAKLLKRTPDITAKQVHEKTGIPERTARRYLAELRQTTTPKETP